MALWVRVRDNDTGHEYDVADGALTTSAHSRLNSKDYPDLDAEVYPPRPVKYRTDKAGSSAKTTKES